MKNFTVKDLVLNGLIGAIYVALTYLFQPLSFDDVQFRIAEVLLIFVIFNPKLSLGIILGTLVSNLLLSPIVIDVIVGTLATILSLFGILTIKKRPAIALLFPVFVNGLLVGAMLAIVYDLPFWLSFISVSFGQAVVLYGLGLPLYYYLNKRADLTQLLK